MRPAFLLLAALLAGPAAADVVPGLPTPETEVRILLGTWDGARVRRDARVLWRILAEDFTLAAAGGRSVSRAELLAALPDPHLRLIEREDLRIRLAADAASTRARVVRIGTAAGPERSEATVETAVLRRESGSWRLVSVREAPAD